MAKPIIEVESLSKCYQLGEIGAGSLRESAGRFWSRLTGGKSGRRPDAFWALKDASFTVERGEIIGVVGRNGAGKSTMLKLLSRITEPTRGRAVLRGKVSALLEIGTGFHPELSGRENIFLNGAILGMRKIEIEKKFDEIVAFAELEKFLDTPVKHYSSGMYVRLGFAIAAHLEPEILIVDEVLAVGDLRFQKKCLGKLKDVSGQGRTVLFVSHNLSVVNAICQKGVLLDRGRIVKSGPIAEVVKHYYTEGQSSAAAFQVPQDRIIGDKQVRLVAGSVKDRAGGQVHSDISINDAFAVEMSFRVLESSADAILPSVHFYNSEGQSVFVSLLDEARTLEPGLYSCRCLIPANLLNEGAYFIGLGVTSVGVVPRVNFFEQNALSISVWDPIEGTPGRNGYVGPIAGVVRPRLEWRLEPKDRG